MNDHNKNFKDYGCALIQNFIDAESISTVSRYMQHCVNSGRLSTAKQNKDESSVLGTYADPLIEIILENSVSKMEKIVGQELYPTYSYARVYAQNDELKPHTDRPSCEYTATVNVNSVGKRWPIWMKSPQGEEASFILNPGDAVVYLGCVMKHWRKPQSTVGNDINVQFMLHYVSKHGANSEFKYDNRESLGLPSELRSK